SLHRIGNVSGRPKMACLFSFDYEKGGSAEEFSAFVVNSGLRPLWYSAINAAVIAIIINELNTLPSGPTVPPLSQGGPCECELRKCPTAGAPLSFTPYRNDCAPSHPAWAPTASQRLPVRRKVTAAKTANRVASTMPMRGSPGLPMGP